MCIRMCVCVGFDLLCVSVSNLSVVFITVYLVAASVCVLSLLLLLLL